MEYTLGFCGAPAGAIPARLNVKVPLAPDLPELALSCSQEGADAEI